MPRALAIARRAVPAAERSGYLADLRPRRDAAAAAGCNFWVFADARRPGEFVEFLEAADAGRLAAAAPGAELDTVYTEVELS